ncbi:hypothetical protein VTL71DRAFT_4651 [Oculimacula yallundae]|uniref:Uncharacterized protein n=1 Tax=Oculimacula yallundae TaxID=86028 RepID=A0ABR4C3R0_9HELO
MKLITICLASTAILVASVIAAPHIVAVRAGEGLPYPVGKMEWTGSATPGGPNVTLFGTVQEVIADLDANYEGFNKEERLAAVDKRQIVAPRTAWWATCSMPAGLRPAPWQVVQRFPVLDGINYLKSLGGSSCGCDAHTCCRISCSWDAAIYLCNDNDYHIGPRCDWQGSNMVQWIWDNCADYAENSIGGKIWDTENYSDTVQSERC